MDSFELTLLYCVLVLTHLIALSIGIVIGYNWARNRYSDLGKYNLKNLRCPHGIDWDYCPDCCH